MISKRWQINLQWQMDKKRFCHQAANHLMKNLIMFTLKVIIVQKKCDSSTFFLCKKMGLNPFQSRRYARVA